MHANDITCGTDQHIARQILDMASAYYRYADDTDAWFRIVGGDHWERCPKSPCRAFVAAVANQRSKPKDENWDGTTPPKANDPDEMDKRLWLRLNNQRSASAIASAMEALAPTRKDRVREDKMDADPFTFWAGGQPYSLRTLEPHGDVNAPHMLTAGYVPATGETPLWDALNEAQFPDDELREYAVALFASILPGGSQKLLPNFKADGNLAKTTRLLLLVDLLGTYAVQLPVQLLGNYNGHDEMYLRLKGKRLAWLDETPPSSKVAAEKLKHLSGGGQLTGRSINGRMPVTFTMQHTLMLAGNDDLPLNDENVQRRVRYLPITGDPRPIRDVCRKIWDHGTLSEAWKAEAPAVLWKLMVQAQAVLADRSLTDMPMAALENFADAIMEQDTVVRFVADCCDGKGETTGSLLYEAYVDWCKRNAIRIPVTMTAFGRRLSDMGHGARKTARAYVRPLTLRPIRSWT